MDAFSKFYSENYKCFDEVLGLLADEESKNTYKAVIDFRKNRNFKALAKYVSYPQYFVKDIFDNCNDEIFVDGGAYIGDTILALSQYMGVC
jgi:hypothetical protein